MEITKINYENFGQEDFTFGGFHRAIVEDNQDPLDVGRVRVRIFGIHSFDEKETPVSHLPWAEPCLSLYYSGGKNLDNKRDKPDSNKRYRPHDEDNQELKRNQDELEQIIIDETLKQSGTGAFFTTPQKGSQVWIFFENGDHTRPIFFGSATKKDDWVQQRNKIVEEINKKRKNVEEIRNTFKQNLDTNEYKGKSEPANKAVLKEINEPPKLNFFNLNDVEVGNEIDNCYITSSTSPGGMTHIIVNKDVQGQRIERHYLIHKSEINYNDHNGQSKRLIGFKHLRLGTDICGVNEPEEERVGNDFQEAIANNYELHIGGDFETHILKSKSVQVDGDMQINVGKNLCLVSREGNVNIIVNKGDCNLSVNDGQINAFSEKNIQINTNSDANIKVKGNVTLQSGGDLNIKSRNIILEASGKFNVKSSGDTSFSCSKFSISSGSFDVKAGSSFKVDGSGFGGDKLCQAAQLSGTHLEIPKPKFKRSPATPTPKSSSPSSASSASSVNFSSGKDTKLEEPNEPAFTDPDE